jgi:Cd2+/Zn2+-exporting ATPase
VLAADLLFSSANLIVEHTGPAEEIIRAVARAGETIRVDDPATMDETGPFILRNRRALMTVVAGAGILLAYLIERLSPGNLILQRSFYLAAILTGGYIPALSGLRAAFGGFSFDMNFLMTLAVIGAVGIGEWREAATVIFLFSLGNTLEAYTLERTRKSISDLVDLAPKSATVRRNGDEVDVPVDSLRPGEVVLIRPGERVPADAQVVLGESAVSEAAITGEPNPEWKTAGSEVFAGSVNGNGYLEARVLRAASDSTLAKIVRLVEEAQAKKAPVERFTDRFARYYTPAVIGLALGIAVVPPLFGADFGPWFYRALTLLVVSCPCALVISTPVSVAAAISNAARNGVLVKGGAYIEQAGSLRAVAFDKTGTITVGRPVLTDVVSLSGLSEDEVLALAASAEHRSDHPFAQAVVEGAGVRGIAYEPAEHFEVLSGKGLKAWTGRGDVWVVSPEVLDEMGVATGDASSIAGRLRRESKSVSVVSDGNKVLGLLAVADSIRPGTRRVIEDLRKIGIRRIAMLTGDDEQTALALAKEAGIEEVHAGLLPQDKVDVLEKIAMAQPVAMVGDGINDAPALAAADIGVAMGAAGTDVALETADIALMGDDLGKLVYAIQLSRRTMRIVRQNVAFALLVKLLAVALVFPGLLTLWLAIAADTGAALVVILNGMRLLRFKAPSKETA